MYLFSTFFHSRLRLSSLAHVLPFSFAPTLLTAQLARIFKNIDMMVAKHPELKGGAPFIIQGMMFLNAPMPVRSVKKAKECFQSAHRVSFKKRE